jgi:ankyrin repeat protein
MKRRSLVFAAVAVLARRAAQADSYVEYFRAVGRDDARTVRALLVRGFDPNAPDERGNTGLHIAMRDDCPQVARALFERPDLEVDLPNRVGETPVMLAALRDNLEWTQRLLARGAAMNREGWTPLHYAASGPGVDLVDWLVARGAALEARAPNGATPLMMAAGYGAIDAADLLARRGADVRARDAQQLNAADYARRAGRDALAGRLDRAAR